MTKRPVPALRKSSDGMRTRTFLLIILLAISVGVLSFTNISSSLTKGFRASAQDKKNPEPLSPQAASQIEALAREKESRTPAQQKIDSNLLYQSRVSAGASIAEGVATLETGVKVDEKGFVDVDITATVSRRVLRKLRLVGAEVLAVVPAYRSITARMPISQIESLAEMKEVIFIQPKAEATTNRLTNPSILPTVPVGTPQKPRSLSSLGADRRQNVREFLSRMLSDDLAPAAGSATSQGDTTHQSALARAGYGVNGTGIKIGVLSDGVTSLAARQATGDLPATVTVLPGQTGTGDEGTAMLEIVHDVAPGAQLYFATAFTSITSFAQNIKDLRTAGCDIIIDDITYFVETPFQDGQAPSVVSNTNGGVVIQAVNDVTIGSQAGALYFSSAGNSGNKNDNTSGVWEGDFVDGGPAGLPVTTVGNLHNFDPGAGITTFNTITTTGSRVSLLWSDPLGGSNNDYDLFRLNSTGTAIAASSTNIQNGTQDPYEFVAASTSGTRLVVVKKTGAANRFMHINTNRGRLTFNTSGVVYGHNGARNAISVGATPAGPAVFSVVVGPFPNPHSATNLVETFSSDGPRRVFFNADSSAITPGDFSSTGGQALQKPDITAADGVTTTTPGFIPFFGTSASAPQAGAMMALLKQAAPAATNTQLYNTMIATAIDIEAGGVDRDSGAGIFMPMPALASLGVPGFAFLQQGTVAAAENPGNANSNLEPGESGTLNIQLSNIGIANATAISATLTTGTAGVSIPIPTRSYSNLVPSASGSNTLPWQFVIASSFPCGGTINFTLTVNYSGGTTAAQAFNFRIPTGTGTFANFFTENLDGVVAPALPAGWTTAQTGAAPPPLFATTATTPDTAPNAAFTNGVATVATNSLISPAIALPAGQGSFQVSFRQTRNFEGTTAQAFDGAVLELSTDGGTVFNNVTSPAVGGSFTSGGYNCVINGGFANPLAGQAAWCATQAAYQTSTLVLPGSLSGQSIRLRWRAGWDNSTVVANPNWRIDTISVAQPSGCATFTATAPAITADTPDPSIIGQNVSVSYQVPPSLTGPGPSGNVLVTDGVDSCIASIAAGQCTLTLTTLGNRTLTATYLGDSFFAAAISSGVAHQVTNPTAAGVSVSGRVLSPFGRGISMALVSAVDGSGVTRTVRTNTFGYFRFDDVRVGETYVFTVSARSYTFASQLVSVEDQVTGLNFVAQ